MVRLRGKDSVERLKSLFPESFVDKKKIRKIGMEG